MFDDLKFLLWDDTTPWLWARALILALIVLGPFAVGYVLWLVVGVGNPSPPPYWPFVVAAAVGQFTAWAVLARGRKS